jgi:monodechloroaminopyrrolnitrin synthase
MAFCLHDDEMITSLDPLSADRGLANLPVMSQAGDPRPLVDLLRVLTARVGEVAALDLPRCQAVMRDLGMVLGSVRRLDLEPVEVVPEVEAVLLALSDRTGMIPRDTIHHLTRWNPSGSRERTYTGHNGERMLGVSVTTSMQHIVQAIEVCRQVRELDVDSHEFVLGATALAEHLRALENSVDITLSAVSPEFFSQTLRPFLQPIKVGGRTWFGPAAAHVPLPLVDLCVWAAGVDDRHYLDFVRQIRDHGVAEWFPLYDAWQTGPSLLERIERRFRAGGEISAELRVGAQAVCRAMRALVRFRGKHRSLAHHSYTGDYTTFSRAALGEQVDVVEEIAVMTRARSALLSQLVDGVREPRHGDAGHRAS